MKNALVQHSFVALRVALVSMVLTGVAYPLVVTGLAALLFPGMAGGDLVTDADGHPVGSALLGQPFRNPGYLQPRPSAAGTGYDANASSGSNLGPTSAKLTERAGAETARLLKENPLAKQPLPALLVTASASGLDPHLSPEAALWQVERIAAARSVSPERVSALIADMVEEPTLGFLGEPRINVLMANLALDRQFGGKPRPHE